MCQNVITRYIDTQMFIKRYIYTKPRNGIAASACVQPGYLYGGIALKSSRRARFILDPLGALPSKFSIL